MYLNFWMEKNQIRGMVTNWTLKADPFSETSESLNREQRYPSNPAVVFKSRSDHGSWSFPKWVARTPCLGNWRRSIHKALDTQVIGQIKV